MSLTSPNRGYPLERIEGNSGSMTYWNALFTRVADRLGDLRTAAQTARDLPGVGQSITAARDDASELVSALAPDIAEAELLAGVLQRYADAWDDHARRANDLIGDIEDAHAEWKRLNAAADNAGRAAMAAAYGDDQDRIDETSESATEAVRARDAAKDALDELWAEYEGYYGDWDDAYDAALAELAAGTKTTLTADARELLDDLLAADSPAEVLRLWNQHPDLRDELLRKHPGILGNLDGIPYDVRAAANYAVLKDLYESDLDEPQRSEIQALWNEVGPHGTGAHLIAFDPDGSAQTTAALWYGAYDAENVSVLIPGMDSNVAGVGEWGISARDLNAGVPGTASVVWFGYDSPNKPEEPFMHRAEDGAAALTGFLRGLEVLQPSSQITVVAHSYGSTTAALAIGSRPDGLGVDQFIVVGSAGFPEDAEILANLQSADAPQIYATLSEDDLWARVGRESLLLSQHSTIPETMDGVIEFGSDGGLDAEGQSLIATPGHGSHAGDGPGGYLMDGSESFYNIQQIIENGRPGTEMDGEGSEAGFWDLPDWLPVNPYRL